MSNRRSESRFDDDDAHWSMPNASNRSKRKPGGETVKAGSKKKAVRGIKLRIIGGSMRGRSVPYHGSQITRPMKDSVRESLFNILGPAIVGTRAMDLFAGTGILAIEAISRGASEAVAVERDVRAADFIKRTLATLDIERRVEVRIGDAFRTATSLFEAADLDQPWTVLICPPYEMWTSRLDSLRQMIHSAMDAAPPGSQIVAESDRQFDPSQLPTQLWDHRTYGNVRLSIHRTGQICGWTPPQ